MQNEPYGRLRRSLFSELRLTVNDLKKALRLEWKRLKPLGKR
jgi:hypothetical protein